MKPAALPAAFSGPADLSSAEAAARGEGGGWEVYVWGLIRELQSPSEAFWVFLELGLWKGEHVVSVAGICSRWFEHQLSPLFLIVLFWGLKYPP